ncbi:MULTISPECIES: hypothetical protein [unclassified Microcoleus]|uniref:hypothetical protein n=1 Tax=unclassified Microcoleus TaxID=2642155 RepID=UPI002FD56802
MLIEKTEIQDYRSLEWNTGAEWSIPLPEYSINGYIISRHYIPDEAPVIPTGWIYEFSDGRFMSEAQISRIEW